MTTFETTVTIELFLILWVLIGIARGLSHRWNKEDALMP